VFKVETSVQCDGSLDADSSRCIFKQAHGELLGLDIESTIAENVGTVIVRSRRIFTPVTIEDLGIR
jgi:hypothetical protein